MSVGLWRKGAMACAVAASLLILAGCNGSDQAVGTDGVEPVSPGVTTSSTGGSVTVAPLPSADSDAPEESDKSTSPGSSQSTSSSQSTTSTTSTTSTSESTSEPPPPPEATVTGSPELGSTGVGPVDPISIKAAGGTLSWVTMKNPDGVDVDGSLSDDQQTWTVDEPLGFGKTYAVTGVATNSAGMRTTIDGTYTTAATRQPISTSIAPGDGAVVGVAQPVIVRFGIRPDDKALIEENLKIVTDPPVEGSWAWITHAGSTYPSLDWRPKEYWPADTKVHVEANTYGLKFQEGWYGGSDVSVDFTIGRNQVVVADAKTNTMTVSREGKVVATYDGSFGMGDRVDDPNLVTRSGTHVVTSKHPEYEMNNPEYDYEDVKEYWAVRISNNGEFIHNNPGTTAWQLANVNKTHGCINLSWDDAKAYFDSAIAGDPVEVTGTSIALSPADGDLFDWALDWDTWLTLSALSPTSVID